MAAQGLSCGMWDLVPQPGIKPRAPVLRDQSLSHWTTRGVPKDRLSKRQSKRYKNREVLTEQAHQHSVKSNRRVDSGGEAFTVTEAPSVHCLT